MVVPEFHCSTLPALRDHIEKFTSDIGFDHYGFAAELAAGEVGSGSRLRFVCSAPSEWREMIESAIANGEPHNMVRHAAMQLPPVGWSSSGHLAGHTIVDDLALDHVRRMAHWNVSAGALCPIAAPEVEWGAVVFFSRTPLTDKQLEELLPVCALYAMNFAFWYLQITLRRDRRTHAVSLSKRELDCLEAAARGDTSQDIAASLGISARTVESYIATACAKLNARGRHAAIARATELKLIGGRNSLRHLFAQQRDASLGQAPGQNPPP